MIDFINEAGIGAIGTVEDARAQVQKLWDQSGGFGCMLLLGHEWANPQATLLMGIDRIPSGRAIGWITAGLGLLAYSSVCSGSWSSYVAATPQGRASPPVELSLSGPLRDTRPAGC